MPYEGDLGLIKTLTLLAEAHSILLLVSMIFRLYLGMGFRVAAHVPGFYSGESLQEQSSPPTESETSVGKPLSSGFQPQVKLQMQPCTADQLAPLQPSTDLTESRGASGQLVNDALSPNSVPTTSDPAKDDAFLLYLPLAADGGGGGGGSGGGRGASSWAFSEAASALSSGAARSAADALMLGVKGTQPRTNQSAATSATNAATAVTSADSTRTSDRGSDVGLFASLMARIASSARWVASSASSLSERPRIPEGGRGIRRVGHERMSMAAAVHAGSAVDVGVRVDPLQLTMPKALWGGSGKRRVIPATTAMRRPPSPGGLSPKAAATVLRRGHQALALATARRSLVAAVPYGSRGSGRSIRPHGAFRW